MTANKRLVPNSWYLVNLNVEGLERGFMYLWDRVSGGEKTGELWWTLVHSNNPDRPYQVLYHAKESDRDSFIVAGPYPC